MLRSLSIRNFVIVDMAEIHFDDGFSVFSGETGAGKSILIDALSLALGARADTGLIRENANRADISAVFEVSSSLRHWLEQHDIDDDSGDLVLRRTIDSNSRSRAYINGVPAPLNQLRGLAEQLVDIHGQHAHQSLLKANAQRELLDAQGQHSPLLKHVQQAWENWQTAEKQLTEAQANKEALAQERERLAWQLDLLNGLSPHEDEWETITATQQRLAHGKALVEGAARALEALEGPDLSAQQQLLAASQEINRSIEHDKQLESILTALDSAHITLSEAISDLNRYLVDSEPDPSGLAQAESRMSEFFDIARRLGVEPQDLPQLHAQLKQRQAELEHASPIDHLGKQVQEAKANYMQVGHQLSLARQKSAKKLAKAVTTAMQELAMKGGRFEIALSPSSPGPYGSDRVEFLVAGHPGVEPRPLAKVASGGELSRLSLALSVIASQAARVPTLIFDEVDAGIGGAIAEVVGKLLQQLGQRHQVLCVTHLPQVAACASHHFQVQKSGKSAGTVSLVKALDEQSRIDEIARMLGGLKITETTRQHAREMLAL